MTYPAFAGRYILGMLNNQSRRINLFLLVRTHAQLQYYLGFSDSRGAANQGGICDCLPAGTGNVSEIHPLHGLTLQRRG
jgi:hypothetical protein